MNHNIRLPAPENSTRVGIRNYVANWRLDNAIECKIFQQ